MFGNRYFGNRYYGDRYFGDGGAAPPVVIPVDTGGSGNQSGRRRRNINDDPEAFSELLKEWRARRTAKSPEILKTTPEILEATKAPSFEPETEDDADGPADDLHEQVRRIEAAFDRSMVAYEAALAKVEQAKVVKAKKAAKAREVAIRQAAIEQEEQAKQLAMQLAIEWELARLAYEDFLEDEDEIMLLS